jgi:hypothetical protein
LRQIGWIVGGDNIYCYINSVSGFDEYYNAPLAYLFTNNYDADNVFVSGYCCSLINFTQNNIQYSGIAEGTLIR